MNGQPGIVPAAAPLRAARHNALQFIGTERDAGPRGPRVCRYGYGFLFSAICPQAGRAVGHVCGRANTDEMNRHLLDIGAMVDEGRHALVVLDGAGWHRSKSLEIPDNAALLRLPPYSPELNPAESVFQLLKAAHFANEVFETADTRCGRKSMRSGRTSPGTPAGSARSAPGRGRS